MVKFRHFFLADMLISFNNSFRDLGMTMAFFFSGRWMTDENVMKEDFDALHFYYYAITVLTLWFRFAQCLARYKDTKLPAHLKNAGKYGTGIIG